MKKLTDSEIKFLETHAEGLEVLSKYVKMINWRERCDEAIAYSRALEEIVFGCKNCNWDIKRAVVPDRPEWMK